MLAISKLARQRLRLVLVVLWPSAIDSLNVGANQASCVAVGPYGTSDAISIPAGTHTLTADLSPLEVPATIVGAGMGQTIIDGDGQYSGFTATSATQFNLRNLTVTGYASHSIAAVDTDLQISAVEINGQNSNPSVFHVLAQGQSAPDPLTVSIEDLHVHSINVSDDTEVVGIIASGSSVMQADLQNITLNDIHSTGAGHLLRGITVASTDSGTVNASIVNTTITNMTGDDLVVPFGIWAFADNGSSSAVADIKNVTVTGLRGAMGTEDATGIKSGAFYSAAAAFGASNDAEALVTVENSLFADNLSDGVSNNCSIADLNGPFDGEGTVSVAILSAGHNISDDASCTTFTQTGDQQNVASIISTIGPLQDNGGNVPTMSLMAGSPAIAAGTAVLGITTDARGVARTAGWDVGAYQSNLGTDANNNGEAGSDDVDQLSKTGQEVTVLMSVVILFVFVASGLHLYRFSRQR